MHHWKFYVCDLVYKAVARRSQIKYNKSVLMGLYSLQE